jgi:hypothetical protein
MRTALAASLGRLLAAALTALVLSGCGSDPSGTYEAKAPGGEDGSLTLDFQDGGKVKMTVSGMGISMAHECTYSVDGDRVTIKAPQGFTGSESIVLMRTGSDYEASEGGETLLFKKK